VNGTARFGIDIRVPGMKVASVLACPVFGGKLKSVSASDSLALPGVIQLLRIEDAVAIVADNTWIAIKALKLLEVEWELGPNQAMSTVSVRALLAEASEHGKPIVALDEGSALEGLSKGAKRLDATYELPFLAHAAMEPINTIVHVRPDACEVWVGTQVPLFAAMYASGITGLPMEKITIHGQLIGGGFGRRLEADSIAQAVMFAKQVPYPLQVVWTREEDIKHDFYRPAYHDRISAALDAEGMPSALWHRTSGGSVLARYAPAAMPASGLDGDAVEGSLEIPYTIPKRLVEWVREDPPEHVPFSWWRGVGPTHNVFVVESFIDELAHEARQDAVEYRRKMLVANTRALAVLNLAAEQSGWGQPLPARSGRGVSLHQSFGSFCAMVVQIEVSEHGDIRLIRTTAAIDCGQTVNPDNVVAQIEGGAIFGLSAALYSGIDFENGRTVQSNFNDYRVLRINEAPSLGVHHIRNLENPGGIGEVGTVSAAPALGNAIFNATGIRIRTLPFDRHRLSEDAAANKVVDGAARAAAALFAAKALDSELTLCPQNMEVAR
jgi:isoquinoline 1-oxidoreductase beta subunit